MSMCGSVRMCYQVCTALKESSVWVLWVTKIKRQVKSSSCPPPYGDFAELNTVYVEYVFVLHPSLR